MKCILLCAGYATRLFPLTENFPKALIDVGGRPILNYILDEVNTLDDVDKIYVVTNHKYAHHFIDWANKEDNVKPIEVIDDGTTSNDDRLGAIGDIIYTIKNKDIDDDLIIIAGDNLFNFPLKGLIDFYNSKNTPVVCIREEKDRDLLKRVGVAEVDENMKIIGFEEKPSEPKSDYAVYAEYVYPKNVIPLFDKYIESGHSSDAPGNFVAFLHKEIDTYGYAFTGECYDVGTHESLAQVNEIYSKR